MTEYSTLSLFPRNRNLAACAYDIEQPDIIEAKYQLHCFSNRRADIDNEML